MRGRLGVAVALVALISLLVWWWLPTATAPPVPTTGDAPTPVSESPERAPRRAATQPVEAPEAEPSTTPDDKSPEVAPSVLRVSVVASESSAPIPDAEVVILEDGVADRTLRSGSDGTCVLSPAPVARTEIRAFVPGRVRDLSWTDPVEAGAEREVTLRLPVGERLVGRVEDREGGRLADVQVTFEDGGTLRGMTSSTASPFLGTATTNAQGEFAFEGAHAGELVTLVVLHRGFALLTRTIRFVGGEAGVQVVIQLGPGGVLSGTVRGSDLQPIADARVLVAGSGVESLLDDPDGDIMRAGVSQRSLLVGRTDADGRYAVHGLVPDAPYAARAIAAAVGKSDLQTAIVAPSGTRTVALDFTVRRTLQLVVRAVDLSGEPIVDAKVTCLTPRFLSIDPSPDGSFLIDGLEPGEVTFDIDADGYVKERITHAITDDAALDVPLDAGLAIEGIAVDDLGDPLPDARIRAMRPIGPKWYGLSDSLADTRTDDDGKFVVGGLHPGAHMVLCWASGHDQGRLLPVDAGSQGARVVARRNAKVTGVLRLPAGAVRPPKLMRQIRRPMSGSGAELDWPDDDRIEIAVPPTPVTLILEVPGYAPVVVDVSLEAGVEQDLGTLTLDQGVTATGRIADVAGQPVAGAEVTASASWAFNGTITRTDADGGFDLAQLAGATYSVEVVADGFLEAEVEMDARTSVEWNVTLYRGARVAGAVRGLSADADARVWLVDLAGNDTDYERVDDNGNYAVRVPPGRYRLEVRRAESEPFVIREIELTEGADESVDIDVPR